MVGPEFVAWAQAFSDFGFVTFTAYLLWERYALQKRNEEKQERRDNLLLESIRSEALAHQALTDSVDKLTDSITGHVHEHQILTLVKKPNRSKGD